MGAVVRRYEIRRKQRRHAALRKWKARLAKATNHNETEKILAKLKKICPWISAREWQSRVETLGKNMKRAA
jgi:hypothetical protein